ncbi:MAG: MlaD family protein [Pseudomonadota bacterium]|nr:MlaD family protein [Pseudomonadota bacterium]
MHKELNNRLIGSFVIGAFVVAFAFVILFGIGKYFRVQDKYIMYFNGSLGGLQEGSPVKFRGVKVGEVSQIRVELDHTNNVVYLPVVISIEPQRINETNIPKSNHSHNIMTDLLAKGLRGKLQVTNLLTGARTIELDTLPTTPIKLMNLQTKYVEIPTLETHEDQLNVLIETASKTLHSVDDLVKSDTLKKGLQDFDDLMLAGADFMISGKDTLKRTNDTLDRTKLLITNFDEGLEPSIADFPDTMRDISETLSSIRVLTDYLARHPDSLLKGKGKDNGKR